MVRAAGFARMTARWLAIFAIATMARPVFAGEGGLKARLIEASRSPYKALLEKALSECTTPRARLSFDRMELRRLVSSGLGGLPLALSIAYPDIGHTDYWLTPVHWAAAEGTVSALDKYLREGVDVHLRDFYGRTPLHWAVLRHSRISVEFRLERGADIDTPTYHGRTALHLAAKFQSLEVAKLLLEKGASLGLETHRGMLPLHEAAEADAADVVRLFLEAGAAINAGSGGVDTPLHRAARAGHAEVVKVLLSGGADVRAAGYFGESVLHAAAYRGDAYVGSLLIKAGADVNAIDEQGFKPLDRARCTGKQALIDILRTAGGHSGFKRHGGAQGILHEAIKRCTLDELKRMFKEGVDVHAVSVHGGELPLSLAVWWRRGEVVELLVSLGADVNGVTEDGKYPLHYAVNNGDGDMIRYLVSKGAAVNVPPGPRTMQPLTATACSGDVDTAKVLIGLGADIHYRRPFDQGNTVLHTAAAFDQVGMVLFLLGQGLDVNVLNRHGESPLHAAARVNRSRAVRFLLSRGAEPSIRCQQGRTALDLARQGGHGETVALLDGR